MCELFCGVNFLVVQTSTILLRRPIVYWVHFDTYVLGAYRLREGWVSSGRYGPGGGGPGIESRWGEIFRTRPDRL